jgi:hypothetical protein
MSNAEITITVQDLSTVRAETADGKFEKGALQLTRTSRDVIAVFDDLLVQDKINHSRHMQVFGTVLYETLLNDKVRSLFEEAYRDAREAKQRLRVQLSFDPPAAELARLPWEFLYYRVEDAGISFATDVDLVLSRFIPMRRARAASLTPAAGPLRVLIATAHPTNLGPVVPYPVIEASEALAENIPVQISELDQPTIDSFLEALDKYKPHVMHYMGHGQFKRDQERGEIAMLDEDGVSVKWVPDTVFGEFFRQTRATPSLVVLHLCEGGVVDATANFAGLAGQLVLIGVQAVVAMQYPITNQAAISFSRAFYRELVKGMPVDDAVQIARYRITTEDLRAWDSRVFGTPVLYMRSRDGIIAPSAA